MIYILKHFDKALIKFAFNPELLAGLSTEIIEIYHQHHTLLPLDLTLDDKGLLTWLKRRVIPKNRAFVQNFLARLGLRMNDTQGIIQICKGLSVNDCYWVVAEDFNDTFANYNLYDNAFDKALALIAYTGYGDYRQSDFVSTPELTTNGALAKAWRRTKDGQLVLYKAGSTGAANLGNEPYSEFYACQIAEVMGLEAVKYNLSRWKKRLCSTCPAFTNKHLSYLPAGHLVTSGGWLSVIAYYQKLGDRYYQSLLDMLIFDAVICNQDRHFGNFGVLLDSQTNTIIKTAPLFDHGLALFHQAMSADLDDITAYAQAISMASGEDFLEFAQAIITPIQKQKLLKLINFKFQKHSSYNLSATRLKIIEAFIQARIKVLLAM